MLACQCERVTYGGYYVIRLTDEIQFYIKQSKISRLQIKLVALTPYPETIDTSYYWLHNCVSEEHDEREETFDLSLYGFQRNLRTASYYLSAVDLLSASKT